MSEPRVLIIGTGLIGASVGLALRSLPQFGGTVLGWDADPSELATALERGALNQALPTGEAGLKAALGPGLADIYLLATPVLPILDWMQRLAPVVGPEQLVTDVGSTKLAISRQADQLFNAPGQGRFLAGHPMAGKESGGAALADAGLFRGAAWLFTADRPAEASGLEARWREFVQGFGAIPLDLAPDRHDDLCAWVSHLPQMLSTALAALLEDTFAADSEGRKAMQAMGGRALRETTRLGSSPYSMWRDVAMTNTAPLAATLLALEQRLTHLRENLRTPELREEFELANRFRAARE